jgi:hypothetical protein
MAQGYAPYRARGTKETRIRNVSLSPINEHLCVAHVAWTATYVRKYQSDVAIDFDVHDLVQELDREPKVFGWVSGDEQALLKEARYHLKFAHHPKQKFKLRHYRALVAHPFGSVDVHWVDRLIENISQRATPTSFP